MPVSKRDSFVKLDRNPSFFSVELVPATRFGAKPPPPNTFLNHQPGPNTPGYSSEADRFFGGSLKSDFANKIDFQAQDKLRKQATIESKIREKQSNNERLNARITMQD